MDKRQCSAWLFSCTDLLLLLSCTCFMAKYNDDDEQETRANSTQNRAMRNLCFRSDRCSLEQPAPFRLIWTAECHNIAILVFRRNNQNDIYRVTQNKMSHQKRRHIFSTTDRDF